MTLIRPLHKVCLLIVCTLLQAGVNAQSANLICTEPDNSMLWEVTGVAHGKVYLYGSLHIGKADFYPLNSLIESAFRESDHLVFEVDPRAADDPAVILDIQTRGLLPVGEDLNAVVSAATVQQLNAVLVDLGLPIESFMTMKPWLLSLVLTNLQVNELGYSAEYGIENYFVSQKDRSTDILELETIQDQISTLEGMDSETFLKYTLDSFSTDADESIEEMIMAWQCADKAPLEKLLFEELETSPAFSSAEQVEMENLRQILFYDRNITMAEGVLNFIENGTGSYFVVVGSGHLLGDGSVIDLLRNKGYQINSLQNTEQFTL